MSILCLSTQQCRHPRTLYFRLLLLLYLSMNGYLLLFLIAKRHGTINLPFYKTNEMTNRVVLFVRTSHNCQSRLKYLLQSWIPTTMHEQSNFYIITDRAPNITNLTVLNSFHNVIQTHCPETHGLTDLCCKTAHEFNLFYRLSRIKSNLEWLCRFDDDHYVNLDNLYKYLSQMNASQPYYIGRTSINGRLGVKDSNRSFSFATYGAGVCFSTALLIKLRPHVNTKTLSSNCTKRKISDDAYIGYLIEYILNVSLTKRNDLFHSHLEKLDDSFRYFSLNDISNSITFGFAWDRYKLEWLPVIHELIRLINLGQNETANHLWLFLRNYEKEHPENLTNKYDESCISYQQLRNHSIALKSKLNKEPVKTSKKPKRTR